MNITDDYKLFLMLTKYPWCWWCGRWGSDVPNWWHGPFLIERAHIVNNPRRCDGRAVVALCSLCHRKQHGARFLECVLPSASIPHMLWLKRTFDPAAYDREFLATCTIGKLPLCVKPPRQVINQYAIRRGGYPNGK